MFDLIEYVVLLHQLGKLIRSEKFADSRLERTRIYKLNRERCLRIHHRHPILNIALHSGKPDAHSAFEKFSNESHAAESKMIYVVRLGFRVSIKLRDVCHDANDIIKRKC